MKKPAKLDFKKFEKELGVELIANGKSTQALHDAVVAYQANRRTGTRSTLTKATVKGSGKKPWRQKGTGRARAGYRSSPVWRGGGVVFGPQPHDYSKKLSKKTKKVALKKALSEVAKAERIFEVDALDVSSGKTKDFAGWMKTAGFEGSLLVVTEKVEPMLLRAMRNIPKVRVVDAQQVNAEDFIRPKQVVVTKNAMPILAKRIQL